MTLEALNLGHLLGEIPIDANDPVAPPDAKIKLLAQLLKAGGGGLSVPSGTRAAPLELDAGTSIAVGTQARLLQFVKGLGGSVTISANPRIAPGASIGQELILKGTSDTNTVALEHGQGVELNGACILRAGSVLTLVWDGTAWGEVSRNDL